MSSLCIINVIAAIQTFSTSEYRCIEQGGPRARSGAAVVTRRFLRTLSSRLPLPYRRSTRKSIIVAGVADASSFLDGIRQCARATMTRDSSGSTSPSGSPKCVRQTSSSPSGDSEDSDSETPLFATETRRPFPADLISEVCQYLADDDAQQTLATLMRVNKDSYRAANESLYRTVTIDLGTVRAFTKGVRSRRVAEHNATSDTKVIHSIPVRPYWLSLAPCRRAQPPAPHATRMRWVSPAPPTSNDTEETFKSRDTVIPTPDHSSTDNSKGATRLRYPEEVCDGWSDVEMMDGDTPWMNRKNQSLSFVRKLHIAHSPHDRDSSKIKGTWRRLDGLLRRPGRLVSLQRLKVTEMGYDKDFHFGSQKESSSAGSKSQLNPSPSNQSCGA